MVSDTAAIAAVVILVILSVLWVLLPFAVFGIKRLLTEAVEEQRRTNDLLEQIAYATSSTNAAQADVVRIATR